MTPAQVLVAEKPLRGLAELRRVSPGRQLSPELNLLVYRRKLTKTVGWRLTLALGAYSRGSSANRKFGPSPRSRLMARLTFCVGRRHMQTQPPLGRPLLLGCKAEDPLFNNHVRHECNSESGQMGRASSHGHWCSHASRLQRRNRPDVCVSNWGDPLPIEVHCDSAFWWGSILRNGLPE